MNDDDQKWVDENMRAEEDTKEDDEVLKRVKRIEIGIEEIYKLLSTKQSHGTKTDVHCNEHGVEMQSAVSKKTNKPYGFHRNEAGQICFGRGYQS